MEENKELREAILEDMKETLRANEVLEHSNEITASYESALLELQAEMEELHKEMTQGFSEVMTAKKGAAMQNRLLEEIKTNNPRKDLEKRIDALEIQVKDMASDIRKMLALLKAGQAAKGAKGEAKETAKKTASKKKTKKSKTIIDNI